MDDGGLVRSQESVKNVTRLSLEDAEDMVLVSCLPKVH
jgi:hypothetical protein